MHVVDTDLAIIGGGGAGLRAAIAAAEADPGLHIALVSKVVPMRSHTVAAEGGSAGVITDKDTLDLHFKDTVSGGDFSVTRTRSIISSPTAPRRWSSSSIGAVPGAASPTATPMSAISAG